MNLAQGEQITHQIIEEVFDYEKPFFFHKYDDSDHLVRLTMGSQLDLHMLFTLKIAYNLKEMAYE